jgi:hypothetical protein
MDTYISLYSGAVIRATRDASSASIRVGRSQSQSHSYGLPLYGTNSYGSSSYGGGAANAGRIGSNSTLALSNQPLAMRSGASASVESLENKVGNEQLYT